MNPQRHAEIQKAILETLYGNPMTPVKLAKKLHKRGISAEELKFAIEGLFYAQLVTYDGSKVRIQEQP